MRKSLRGFTIVELLTVIVVIGILAAISITAYTNIQARAQESHRQSTITQLNKLLSLFYAEHGAYPSANEITGSAGTLTFGVPIEALSPPEQPTAGIVYGNASSNGDYRFRYITHPNVDGSGINCTATIRCASYHLTYRTKDGTVKGVTNPGHRPVNY